ALFVVGPDLEQRIGKVQYSLLYIITALGGSLLSVEFHPVQVSAGASGAIFGLVGCYLAYIPPQFAKQGKKTLKRRIMVLFLFLAINFAFAQIVGNVDNAAHMGGLITGLLFGWVASKTTLKDRPLLAYMNSLGLLLLCLSSYLFMSAQYNNDPRLLAHREFFDGMTLLQDKKYGEALTRFD